MKKVKKIKIGILAALLIMVICFVCNIIFRYFKYDAYKQYLSSYEVENGSEFKAIGETAPDVKNMVLVTENDNYKLYTNLRTTEIAIYDKQSGHITYSNPQDRDKDSIAAGVNVSELNSTLSVTYYNAAKNSSTMNNYDMSIQYEQFEVQAIENGIRYVYTFADPSKSAGIVPDVISEERLQSLVLDKLSDKDARTIKGKYKLKDGIYTILEKAKNSKVGMKKLNTLFEEAGYTEADCAEDMGDTEVDEQVSFTIPLEYRLTEDGLNVSVPTDQIQETGGAMISRLRLLPFLGAAGMTDEGYMFVPNGSGALIDLNNGCKNAAYTQNIYGIDPVAQSYVVTEYTQTARLPVFGMKNGDNAFFARIKNGDALAIINADVSGKLNSYNYVYPEFCLREIELLNMFGVSGNKSDTPMLEKNMYDLDISVDYTMLSGDEANYSGMANYYREKLQQEGVLTDTDITELPFYLDIVGGVEIQKHALGIPYDGVFTMTTYDEAQAITDELNSEGIKNIRMNYQGWFNGGIYHDVADSIKLIRSVGSKKDMSELADKLEAQGGGLYGDVAFQKAVSTSDGFNGLLEASKYYSGYAVELGAVNPATMRQTSNLKWYDELVYDIVSPKFLNRYVEKFSDKVKKYDMTGINLRDLGDVLASDKKRTEFINRQQAKDIVIAQYDKLADTGKKLMENGGNEYSLAYVSDIIDAPTSYSRFYIIDEQVPFYEMVVHGSINYAGNAINLSDNALDQEMLLQYIEYGIAPRFTLSYKDSSNIKYTSSSNKYSVKYETWLNDASDVYRELSKVLNQVAGAKITDHELLESGLVKVEYSNGIIIYVNKTEKNVSVGDISVDAMSYTVKGGAQ